MLVEETGGEGGIPIGAGRRKGEGVNTFKGGGFIKERGIERGVVEKGVKGEGVESSFPQEGRV